MRRIFYILAFCCLALLALAACQGEVAPNEDVPPTAVSISSESGETLALQEGPIWVLLSGVDEHGLIAEHELLLLTEPDPNLDTGTLVHTGVSASVLGIQQGGPQNLQRFYHVKTVDGVTGWISGYYVRRVAYVYDAGSDGVDLYSSPGGETAVTRLANVSPISMKEPSAGEWWLVQSVQDGTLGWVRSAFVVESPSPEFLLNPDHQHNE